MRVLRWALGLTFAGVAAWVVFTPVGKLLLLALLALLWVGIAGDGTASGIGEPHRGAIAVRLAGHDLLIPGDYFEPHSVPRFRDEPGPQIFRAYLPSFTSAMTRP